MRVDWQQIASLMIVAIAAVALVSSRFRRPKAPYARSLGCCSAATAPLHHPSVTYHSRKGERSQIVVKLK